MITPDELQTPDPERLTNRAVRRRPRRGGRRPEPSIADPSTHPREEVCVRVAAEFLGMDRRTVVARIEDRVLEAWRDGKVYRIPVSALVAYRDEHR
jgi:excisionase family DNA binding protein